jgi:hypothetical protein
VEHGPHDAAFIVVGRRVIQSSNLVIQVTLGPFQGGAGVEQDLFGVVVLPLLQQALDIEAHDHSPVGR